MRPDSSHAGIDVLIADDDHDLRASVRSFLELKGFRCAEAQDGQEAVEVALRRPPRCVLLDLAMPRLDGLAVARLLRADPRTRNAHVHCLTGRADAASRLQAEEAGCERFFTKPVDPEAVLQAVQDVGPATEVCRPGLTRDEAERLLDWMEANGLPPGQVEYVPGEGFQVRAPLAFPPRQT
jgi:CheY-like chemotaxis protein